MNPVTLPETIHNRGDLWEDGYRKFGPVLIDGSPLPDQALYCRMQFRHIKTEALGYELNTAPATGQGKIIITDATAWTFEIPAQALPLDAGVWEWDIEIYTTLDHSDIPRTPWRGSIKITKDVSHD